MFYDMWRKVPCMSTVCAVYVTFNISTHIKEKSCLCEYLITGKQLFETDRNLDTSDIQFLEDGEEFYIYIYLADTM